ncbi:MAG: DoxX family protein [Candidatus Rhabdochlamydia sp.]
MLLGRALYSAIFILASFGHFNTKTIHLAASQGVLFANILVPFSGVLALVGGLSILLGYKARYGAWLLVLFLVPVTYMMHKFWVISDPTMHGLQQVMFMKNMSLLGAALLIAYFGSGPLSIKK